jgi:chaperonin GroEL
MFSLDGVTVAKQISVEDEAENDGVELVKGVARETDKSAGDGTTTATILVQSILKQGMKALSSGIDHTKMKKGMDEALDITRAFVKKISRKIKSKKEISEVATISSRDPEIGEVVADIIHKIGKDAVVTVEESKAFGLHSEMVEGMQVEKGYISPYMVTDQQRGEAILENPYILVTSQVISTSDDILKLLQEVLKSEKRSLLIIAEEVKGEALGMVIINKLQGRVMTVAVKAPGLGDDKTEQLKDIAAVVGCELISEETGRKVEDVTLEDLGRADRVVVSRENTIIVGGQGNPKKRIEMIVNDVKNETSDYKREAKEKRLAKLKGGVAVIKVGSISEEENMEKRYRIEDAVRSAKSSLEEGVVPGAGMTLFRAAEKIRERMTKELDLSYRTGLSIIEEAISEPAKQIIKNAGEDANVVLSKIGNSTDGYDSAKGEYVDLIKAGIMDPAKVVRVAIENAVSIASMFLITGAVITEAPKKENENRKDD